MSASDPPETSKVERELAALEVLIGRLLERLDELARRAAGAEAAYRELDQGTRQLRSGDMRPQAIEMRLRQLSEENERLRSVVIEGRKRAERIRGRLMVMEDDA